jgi:hypothetical protein
MLHRVALAVLVLGAALAGGAAATTCGLTLFVDRAELSGNSFNTDALDPPPGLTATGGVSASLQWTATPDAYASGYRIYRSDSSGGPYTLVGQVTPRSATSYTDAPPPGVHFYVVRAFYQGWESADSSEVSVTVN